MRCEEMRSERGTEFLENLVTHSIGVEEGRLCLMVELAQISDQPV